jgi:hypothetical protein
MKQSTSFKRKLDQYDPVIKSKINEILHIFSKYPSFLMENAIKQGNKYLYPLNDFFYIVFSKEENRITLEDIQNITDKYEIRLEISNPEKKKKRY